MSTIASSVVGAAIDVAERSQFESLVHAAAGKVFKALHRLAEVAGNQSAALLPEVFVFPLGQE